MTVSTVLSFRKSHKLAHSPERAMTRSQCSDLGLVKVLAVLSRGTDVVGGEIGFALATIKRDRLPLTRESVRSSRQVYDALRVLFG